MNLEDFLATPFQTCIRLRVGAGLEDVVEVDQTYWEANKQDFIDFCLELDEVEGHNWRSMKQHTGGNGMLAKLLIALGDLAEVWTMHPPRDAHVGLWSNDLPRVLIGPTHAPIFPKPSYGALEADKSCDCCGRPMGPPDSMVHDLPTSEKDDKLCLECEAMDCELEEDDCKVFPEKVAEQKPKLRLVEAEQPTEPPPGIAEYLKQFM